MRQTNGKDLIWADSRVRRPAIHYVIQAFSALIPEQLVETPVRERSHVAVTFASRFIAKSLCQIFHDPERVVPQRLDLHWLPGSRSDHPVANFGVHPGKLHAGL